MSVREQSEKIHPSRLIKLIDFSVSTLFSHKTRCQLYTGLAEQSISECQWVTVGKLAALRILNDQNTHLNARASTTAIVSVASQ